MKTDLTEVRSDQQPSLRQQSLPRILGGIMRVEYDQKNNTVWYQDSSDPSTRLRLPQPTERLQDGQTRQLYLLERLGEGPNDYLYTTYEYLREKDGHLLQDKNGNSLIKATRVYWFSELAQSRSLFPIVSHFQTLSRHFGDDRYSVAVMSFKGTKGSFDHRLNLSTFLVLPDRLHYADFKSTQGHEAVHMNDYMKEELFDLGRQFGASASEVRAHLWQKMLYERFGFGVPVAYQNDDNIISTIQEGYGEQQAQFAEAYIRALRKHQAEKGLEPNQDLLNVSRQSIEQELSLMKLESRES